MANIIKHETVHCEYLGKPVSIKMDGDMVSEDTFIPYRLTCPYQNGCMAPLMEDDQCQPKAMLHKKYKSRLG